MRLLLTYFIFFTAFLFYKDLYVAAQKDETENEDADFDPQISQISFDSPFNPEANDSDEKKTKIISIPYSESEDLDINEEVLQKSNNKSESHDYQTEVTRLLDIIINSLYGQREVFVRELISNAADAIEKIRFMSLTEPSVLDSKPTLDIRIEFDEQNKTISITDSGIGMTKQELINNLGTIAKSGTTNFMEALADTKDVNLIGQFGVGFYSAFLVSDKVTVVSKNNDDDAYIWTSTADASFSVVKDPRGDVLGRGTRITLHMKEDAVSFLDEKQLQNIIHKFSQFIQYPIYLRKNVTEEVPLSEEELEEEGEKEEDEGVSDETNAEKNKKEEKKKTKTIWKYIWQQMNTQKALWLRNKDEVTETEYLDFYRSLSKSEYAKPLTHIHFTAEGEVEFKSILFVPEAAPYNAWDHYMKKQDSIKLYVRRVMVAETFDDLVPKYMNFLKGVVDSDDLPLKVDRENIAQQKIVKVIGKRIVRKVLDHLRKMSKDRDKEYAEYYEKIKDMSEKDAKNVTAPDTPYDKFMINFGSNMKMGCAEDDQNRVKIVKLLRFNTLLNPDHMSTLDTYVTKMPESQKSIYYLSGDKLSTIMESPLLQRFKKNNVDVLLLTEPSDEGCLARLTEFENFKLVNVQKGDIDLDDSEESKKYLKRLKKYYSNLTSWWSKLLPSELTKVEISQRLVTDPVTVSTTSWGYSAQMEKLMKSQAFANKEQLAWVKGSRVLEINGGHALIKKLKDMVDANKEDEEARDLAKRLTWTGMIGAGFDVESVNDYINAQYNAFSKELGVADQTIEELDLPEEAEEEDKEVNEPIDLDDIDTDDVSPNADNDETEKKANNEKDEL